MAALASASFARLNAEGMKKSLHDACCCWHNMVVEIHHANEFQTLDRRGPGKLPDGSYLGGQWRYALFGDVMAKEVYLLPAELALGQIDVRPCCCRRSSSCCTCALCSDLEQLATRMSLM